MYTRQRIVSAYLDMAEMQALRKIPMAMEDWERQAKESALFFAEVQIKLLFAAAGKTAAELIVDRADPTRPNMALTSWSGSCVGKQDIIIAKNYLSEDEVDTLNRLVVIFLEQAELRAKQQKELTLEFWRGSVDRMLASNDQPLLGDPERRKEFFKEYKEIEMLYDIISTDAFLRPFIEDYVTLATIATQAGGKATKVINLVNALQTPKRSVARSARHSRRIRTDRAAMAKCGNCARR